MNKPAFILALTLIAFAAQVSSAADTPQKNSRPVTSPIGTSRGKASAAPLVVDGAKKKFVLDVVKTAVALSQSDPQDRLRVLTSAANVVAPVQIAMAKRFAREGTRIEAELINSGQTPAVSLIAAGHVDCTSAGEFVDNVPAAKVGLAEQSLIGAVTMCPKRVLPSAQRKLEAALADGNLAPRALLVTIEKVGPKSAWSQTQFEKLFSSLPADANSVRKDAPNFAAMYDRMAGEVDRNVARKAGISFLVWLGKLDEGGERNMAVNILTDSMKKVLGQKAYNEALEGDVMARQVAQTAGQPGSIDRPEEETVSVLRAMDNSKTDRTDELSTMTPSLRAREAAASGFATGTQGNRRAAERYFDMAFSAADEVWSSRQEVKNAPAVIEEVSEAAAQVDPVAALQRAQKLQDPSAQAISMLAVARVVVGK